MTKKILLILFLGLLITGCVGSEKIQKKSQSNEILNSLSSTAISDAEILSLEAELLEMEDFLSELDEGEFDISILDF